MNLVELDQGVFAYVHPNPRFGYSNVGLIIDADGLTVFDTTATPNSGDQVKQAMVELTAQLELPIKRVVLSSSRVPFSGGGQPFWASAFYGSEVTSDQLDAPPNPHAFRRLLPDFAADYPDDFATRPITHTVSEPAWLTSSCYSVPLDGESAGNLVLHLPGANVVFCGALASFGVTPLAYDANLSAWIESLQQVMEMGTTIIPGHGMPGGHADVGDLIGYLAACIDADGDPGRIGSGPWDSWSDRRFDAVNVERAALLARGINEIPQSMFALLGMA
jgi:cyclase